MKKILSVAVCCTMGATAQETATFNELELNILNTILLQSVEVGYQHFIDENQSIGAEVMINDRFSSFTWEKGKKGDRDYKAFNTNSVALNYKFYFGGDFFGMQNVGNGLGLYISPFLKYRFGDYSKAGERKEDGIYDVTKVNMNSFIIGVGSGYKFVYKNTLTITPFVNIARNFGEEVKDQFWGVEPNVGLNIGYRF